MAKHGKRTPHSSRDSDRAAPVTGANATMDEAELGTEGNGASLLGADFTGGFPDPLEQDPGEARDLLPDRVIVRDRHEAAIWDEQEEAVTARETEWPDTEDPEFRDPGGEDEDGEAFEPYDQ